MANLGNFDANDYEPNIDFELIPEGKYLVAITESIMKQTKSKTGEYLELKFQILDGEFENRFLWSRLNLKNPSEIAVKIARGDLSAICRAVGVMAPTDSAELHGIPLMVTVKCKTNDNDETRNELKGYAKAATAPMANTMPPPQPQVQAPQEQAPWRRNVCITPN